MATTWGPGFVLKGADGAPGPKGDLGPAGPKGDSVTGPKGDPGIAGAAGKDGVRGSQTYKGNGPPSNDLSSFSPPAMAGDTYYDLSGGPTLYFL